MAEQRGRHGSDEPVTGGHEPDGNGAASAGLPATDAGDIAALREQLEQERARADTNYGNWQRATADFINFKRRTEQEREETGPVCQYRVRAQRLTRRRRSGTCTAAYRSGARGQRVDRGHPSDTAEAQGRAFGRGGHGDPCRGRAIRSKHA